jgi:hypothetical protein
MFNCTELLDEDVDDSLFPNKDNSQLDLFEWVKQIIKF